jgi:short-subunit dehydrogenase
MRERKAGTIVNIGSSNSIEPVPALGIYTATKFAMDGMFSSLCFVMTSYPFARFTY